MNAQELFLKDGKSSGVFFCEKCRMTARTQEAAEQCCKSYVCRTCGKDTKERFRLICDACWNAEQEATELARFNAAEKVYDWPDWIYDGSEFFESVDDMLDVKGDDEKFHEYVWTCVPYYFVHADISDITERLDDVAYEGFDPDTLDGLDELKIALDKFNEANKNVCSYSPDYSKAVLIKPASEKQ